MKKFDKEISKEVEEQEIERVDLEQHKVEDSAVIEEIKLKEKFNQKLKDRITDSKFISVASGNMAEDEENIIEEEEKEEEEIVQSVSNQEWTSETGKCPACDASISENATICPECGLTIN